MPLLSKQWLVVVAVTILLFEIVVGARFMMIERGLMGVVMICGFGIIVECGGEFCPPRSLIDGPGEDSVGLSGS